MNSAGTKGGVKGSSSRGCSRSGSSLDGGGLSPIEGRAWIWSAAGAKDEGRGGGQPGDGRPLIGRSAGESRSSSNAQGTRCSTTVVLWAVS